MRMYHPAAERAAYRGAQAPPDPVRGDGHENDGAIHVNKPRYAPRRCGADRSNEIDSWDVNEIEFERVIRDCAYPADDTV